MNILLLAWNRLRTRRPKPNVGHELFRRNLAKYHNVVFYGQEYFCDYNPDITLNDLLEKYGKPDFVFTHVEHRKGKFPAGIFDELGKMGILKVHYCGDYERREWDLYNEHFKEARYDIIFVPDTQVLKDLKQQKIGGEHFFLPFSVDTSIFYDRHLEKIIDVAAPIRTGEKCRKRLRRFVDQLDVRTAVDLVYFDKYIQRINESKIIVTCNHIYKQLGWKYTEVLACGTLIMGDKSTDFDRLGFKDGEHLILYDDIDDLTNKINYFLEHDQEREIIAKNGMEFVRKYHSSRVRIAEFIEMIRTRKQIDWNERINQNFTPLFSVHF